MPLNQHLKKNSPVLWTISLIQDQNPTAQTKEEFSEMAQDVLNTETISKLTLCLADNLQRFRLMINHGLSEEDAIKECQKLSNTWSQDNSSTLEKLKASKNLSLLTWEEFLAWPKYQHTVTAVEELYKTNQDFRQNVDARIRIVRNNITENAKISDVIEQNDLLKKYLFEECAFQKFAASKGFNYEIYKNQHCKAMRRIKNNSDFVPSGLMVEIFFKQFDSNHKLIKNSTIPTITPNYSDREVANKPSFSSVFSTPAKSKELNESIYNAKKISEFIEKTFQLIPLQQQEKAIEALLKFSAQEIIPLCYVNNASVFKL